MRKTAILPLDAYSRSEDILCKLQPIGDKILDASIASKPGEADILVIHYDDDNGKITDTVLLGMIHRN